MNTINWFPFPTFVPPRTGYFLITRKSRLLVQEAYWHDNQWWAVDWLSEDAGYQKIDVDTVIAYAEFPDGSKETET